jgi:hypothetical protein
MVSDISGSPLEGSNNPVAISVTFPDGARRNLNVSSIEAARLKEAGTEASSWYSWTEVKPWLKRALVVVLAAWFASILIPAIVQQWADRAKELELKKSLVTRISDSAAEVTLAAFLVERQLLPHDKATHNAYAELQRLREKAARPPSRSDQRAITAAEAAWRKASNAEALADQKYYNETRDRWNRRGATIQAELETYFGGSAARQWRDYTQVLTAFLRLASSVSGEERRKTEEDVLIFLQRFADVEGDSLPRQRVVADKLLAARYEVLEEVLNGNAKGYSTGTGDLIRSVTLVPDA